MVEGRSWLHHHCSDDDFVVVDDYVGFVDRVDLCWVCGLWLVTMTLHSVLPW